MKCNKCGNEFSDEHNFCSFCGATLKNTKYCPRCGCVNDGDACFCNFCGYNLNEIQSEKINYAVVWLGFTALFAVYVCISLFV